MAGTIIAFAPFRQWDAPQVVVTGGNGAVQLVWDALKAAGHEMVTERPFPGLGSPPVERRIEDTRLSDLHSELLGLAEVQAGMAGKSQLALSKSAAYVEAAFRISKLIGPPTEPCPFCVGRIGRVCSTCEDCMGSGVVQKKEQT